jgi:hypothetical protein
VTAATLKHEIPEGFRLDYVEMGRYLTYCGSGWVELGWIRRMMLTHLAAPVERVLKRVGRIAAFFRGDTWRTVAVVSLFFNAGIILMWAPPTDLLLWRLIPGVLIASNLGVLRAWPQHAPGLRMVIAAENGDLEGVQDSIQQGVDKNFKYEGVIFII